jgi:hypothetical protein
MFDANPSYDYRPLGHWGKIPLTITNSVIIGYVAWIFAVLVYAAVGGVPALSGLWNTLMLNTNSVIYEFKFWQLFSYALLFNMNFFGLLITALMLYFFFRFGNEVEQFLGRQAYLTLLMLVVVVPAVAMLFLHFFEPVTLAAEGSWRWLVFVAFAIIYPNVRIFFEIKAWWLVAFFVGIVTLFNLAGRRFDAVFFDFVGLFTTYYFLRYVGVSPRFEFLTEPFRQMLPKRRAKSSASTVRTTGSLTSNPGMERRPAQPPKPPREEEGPEQIHEDIDPILEKISKHGMSSLTDKERKKLENARSNLLKDKKP